MNSFLNATFLSYTALGCIPKLCEALTPSSGLGVSAHNILYYLLAALLPFCRRLARSVSPSARASTSRSRKRGGLFLPASVEIDKGDTLAIRNDDEYIHQVYVSSPSFNFDSGEQEIARPSA